MTRVVLIAKPRASVVQVIDDRCCTNPDFLTVNQNSSFGSSDIMIKNVEFNVGGIIALVCAGVTAAIVFGNGVPNEANQWLFRLPIFALTGGALGGNYL